MSSAAGPVEYEIREFRPGDEAAILRLFGLVFDMPVDDAAWRSWRWRFEANPARDRQIMLCMLPDGTLAAHFSCMPLRAQFEGRPCRMALAFDAMSHPDYRGAFLGRSGFFAETAHAASDRFGRTGRSQFIFGFPNPRHRRLGELLLGYTSWDVVSYQAKALRRTVMKSVRALAGRLHVEPFREFGAEADRLWDELRSEYPTSVVRDSTYLNWRYRDCPNARYRMLALRGSGGRWLGWLVMSVDREKARLVDLLLPRRVPDRAQALLHVALDLARREGAPTCEAWMQPGTPGRELVDRAGFWSAPHPAGHRLSGRVFDPAIDPEAMRRDFYYHLGDTDYW